MNLKVVALILAQVLASASLPVRAGLDCDVRTGPNTAALVELYTSEGCSSCPPADQLLSRLQKDLGSSAQVVPLSLHVGYWDSLGWTDRFAQERFARRQAWLVRVHGQRTVYTPQFFVAGTEPPPRRTSLADTVQRLNTTPATAAIRLRGALSADGILTLDANATANAVDDDTALYLAITENGLQSRVRAGENRGAILAHDHVVREWLGPFPLRDGAIQVRREIRLASDWRRERLELVAFVQNERTGAVLQAAACPGS